MKTLDFVDAIRARYDCSDYRAAQLLGITRSTVSGYRCRGGTFDDDVAIKAAQLLGMSEEYVLAEVAAERSKSPAAVSAWKRAAEMLARLSPHPVLPIFALALLLGALAAPVKGYAHAALHSPAVAAVQEYILCKFRGYCRTALAHVARALRSGPRQPISAACLAY